MSAKAERGIKMRKRTTVVLCALALAVVVGMIWWIAPTRFLRGVDIAKVAEIHVFSGMTGEDFTISEPEQVAYIVESFQKTAMKRYGLSLGRMGYGYRMHFLDGSGKALASLILNSENTVRRDPFFYGSQEGVLCYDYLQELEKREKQEVCRAVIREIGNSTMLVELLREDGGCGNRGLIAVSMCKLPESAEPQVGDTLTIAWDGCFLETYPVQLGEVYSITLEE